MQLKELNVGGIKLKNNVLLAPIAGYTDFAFRGMCVFLGAAAGFTELVSCKGLLYDNQKTAELLYTDQREAVRCVQIFGREPDIMRRACESEYLQAFDIIDINMGCPAPKLFKNGEGSALLAEPKLAAKIIEECAKCGKPVTVKFRTGITDGKAVTADFARMCEDAGAAMITVHGRSREAYYSGEVNYRQIELAKNSVKIPVIANGGVFTKEDADVLIERTGADGIMVARGALYNPLIFSEITKKDVKIDKKGLILNQIDTMLTKFDDRYTAVNLRKLIALYIKGIPDSRRIKNEIFACNTTDKLKEVIASVL